METVPQAVGIIIDGNRRWAKARGLPKLEGHRVGLGERVKDVTRWARDAGVGTLYLYAFSTENWNRDPLEVNYLMDLLANAFDAELKELAAEGARLRFIGERERLSKNIQKLMERAEADTSNNTGITLVVCISYGGKTEILAAANKLLASSVRSASEKDFRRAMWSGDLPDPDIIIRTGGEQRLSNFLLYQAAYAELFFTPTMWPDFSKQEFTGILKEFAARERRHGK